MRLSLKVTVVRVGVAQEPPEVVVLEGDEVLDGHAVLVAELQGPLAEPLEQTEGSLA